MSKPRTNIIQHVLAGKHGRAWYTVLFALRGPDCPESAVQYFKDVFTARLRVLVCGNAGGIIGDMREHARIWPGRLAAYLDEIMSWDYGVRRERLEHFNEHIRYALDGLLALKLIEKDEYQFLLSVADTLKDTYTYSQIASSDKAVQIVLMLVESYPQFFEDAKEWVARKAADVKPNDG